MRPFHLTLDDSPPPFLNNDELYCTKLASQRRVLWEIIKRGSATFGFVCRRLEKLSTDVSDSEVMSEDAPADIPSYAYILG